MMLVTSRKSRAALIATAASVLVASAVPADDLLPKHITPKAQAAIKKGLDYLAQEQEPNGSYIGHQDGSTYPTTMAALAGMAFLANGNSPSRGPYADQVRRIEQFLVRQSQSNGLIASGAENGRPMYGHGFSLLFLSTVYGMETDPNRRREIADVVEKAIQLTATGQSNLGGWMYTPGSGDEGSVTVTQMQGLRAAHDAGFTVPEETLNKAIRYLEMCRTGEGGIRYSYHSGGDTRLPITAAAVCCLYSAGEYDSPLADSCLDYTYSQFKAGRNEFNSGHNAYLHLYASQAFYQAGDDYWDQYFPAVRDRLIREQSAGGTWQGDGVGEIYGTSLACILLQLPYKFLPVYQR